jgi:GNAT superfamily N-acetyltransferase
MRDVLGIGRKPPQKLVIETVSVIAEWLVVFQHYRGRVIGTGLPEHLAHALERLNRSAAIGAHRNRVGFADRFQLRDGNIQDGGEPQP